MKRAYYSSSVNEFIVKDIFTIFGEITCNDQFAADDLQKNTWKKEIGILKRELSTFKDGHLLFEYTIPRIGSRIDNVLIYKGIVFLLEFKVDEDTYPRHAIEQVTDYALDLNCFHKESHDKLLVPILICTKAPQKDQRIRMMKENILETYCCNESNIGKYIKKICTTYNRSSFNSDTWINSLYMPTPTIIEAAQALYMGHNVEDISRNDASAKNLNQTTKAINKIIDYSKTHNRKSICFITGVPGAGKTLAGLNIAIERQKVDENEHAVFLSGNGPLVDVLQEALARDDVTRNGIRKSEAIRKAKEFIQIIHHFRDEAISVDTPPIERVTIFDEAQRAWDEPNLTNFMKRKKGVLDFNMSEPEFLISILNRHIGWATIVCLIGGGQEINKGESDGISGWFESLRNNYSDWDVYISNKIIDEEYSKGNSFDELTEGVNYRIIDDLHLSVSLRSFRSENVSTFVKAVLDVDKVAAKELYNQFKKDYPICVTRDLELAKKWVRDKSKGSQRYGMTASSGAKRLRKYGVWVQNKIDATNWFLNGKDDVRASYFLEETATEFDIQGLELDWTIVCWDGNLRFKNNHFEYYNFNGTKWQNINKEDNILYLKNAYRVLLTRARQGFIIFVPIGDESDITMQPNFYNGVYEYLKEIGIEEL
ncbi:DUF2075 domain-containing protein [Clostridioides difficile]|uniref:DUF2075 domain-containing protein n=2 Tax=Clostridioides difficile TaxID=1496 RepID=UPI000BB17B8D|nr:DUF2075 domain-containing protein [Clostridioides difficile]MBY2208336.1 DUF2075 domain-containing protein [Clostridioides difficile]MBZ0594816.1 DUF2075 domain-containing protein [Clostridioides difficile]MCR1644533.1 DUF2075 domain-containing protein [Clostridioides difficile]PBH61806.1 hypothetical protein BGV07_02225 [Clostridioides difficile]HBG0707360.1 DUF2075 domain-containing protein [Clostridioides difficile]